MHATMFNNKTAKKESMHKNTKGKLKDRACMQPCSTTKPPRKKACTKTQKESSKTEHACRHTSNHVQQQQQQQKTPRKKACTQTQKKVQRIHEFFMLIFQTKLVVTFKLS
jgi:hypothetical protein